MDTPADQSLTLNKTVPLKIDCFFIYSLTQIYIFDLSRLLNNPNHKSETLPLHYTTLLVPKERLSSFSDP